MSKVFNIRTATDHDIPAVTALFRDTIFAVNSRDYTPEQVLAWSKGAANLDRWKKKIADQYFLVAVNEGAITGFASLATDGYVDFMFVHKDFQRQGIAQALLNQLEQYARQQGIPSLYSEVSITARAFFEKSGFTIIAPQEKIFEGEVFVNYRMGKLFSGSGC